MKTLLKAVVAVVVTLVVFALATLIIVVAVYGEVPDVSKWSCPNAGVKNFPKYGAKVTTCDSNSAGSFYVKVSGELVYVHEHRKDADGKNVYYNALKTNKGNWVEVVNKDDLIWRKSLTQEDNIEMSITNDNGVVIAKRIIPLLKK